VITAVDSNVLIDVLEPDPLYGPASAEALRFAAARGGLVACDVVWAEVSGRFSAVPAVEEALDRLGVEFSALEAPQAFDAGATMTAYRRRGGTRARLVADFLVGAHARGKADRLLTRDRGFFRSYFADLEVIDPGAA
jgi:predicted nucleic acid-binding protein